MRLPWGFTHTHTSNLVANHRKHIFAGAMCHTHHKPTSKMAIASTHLVHSLSFSHSLIPNRTKNSRVGRWRWWRWWWLLVTPAYATRVCRRTVAHGSGMTLWPRMLVAVTPVAWHQCRGRRLNYNNILSLTIPGAQTRIGRSRGFS